MPSLPTQRRVEPSFVRPAMVPLWVLRNLGIAVILVSCVSMVLLISFSPDKERLLQDYGLNHRDGKTFTQLVSMGSSVGASFIVDLLCMLLEPLANPRPTFVLWAYAFQTTFWSVLMVLFMLSSGAVMTANPASSVAIGLSVAMALINLSYGVPLIYTTVAYLRKPDVASVQDSSYYSDTSTSSASMRERFMPSRLRKYNQSSPVTYPAATQQSPWVYD